MTYKSAVFGFVQISVLNTPTWCNLAKSYIFGFLLEWRARWYKELAKNIIFSWDGKFSLSSFPDANFRHTGDFSPENYPYYGENTFLKKKLENHESYPRILQSVPIVLEHSLTYCSLPWYEKENPSHPKFENCLFFHQLGTSVS